ncbi:hypothetical protein [Nocardioides acrostichi]|uniref:Uncharacterized protein n=1 Tax=Nocardioides acrostichi TaxID=2784339 RepID=A0A930V3N8_9ACTN|nr:hypothetical protein [Nocardioides acrostichi]MBF4162634.1 hypothetical protein [Nocardioides acrostichi]
MIHPRVLVPVVCLALLIGGAWAAVVLQQSQWATRAAADGECAPGYQSVDDALREVRAEMRTESESEREAERAEEAGEESGEGSGEEHGEEGQSELVREAQRELPMLAGTDPDTWDTLCVIAKRPESLTELNKMADTRGMPRLAPLGAYDSRAGMAAVRQAAAIDTKIPAAVGRASLYGKGPLVVDDPDYPQVNGLGLGDNMGRIDSFDWDPRAKRLFAAVGNGGIWRSDDLGDTWVNANGNLPTTVTGAVAWTRAKGGHLLALTGEPTFGSSAYTGLGAYWSGDLGKHWRRSKGLPSGALGFALAVDPKHRQTVYAATQFGLFRSDNAGRSYTNVKLPTGPCAGVTSMKKHPECALANVVTDVNVVYGGGVNTDTKAHTVVAAVGWRGGQRKNADGREQSPNNGIYRSANGRPGTFDKLDVTGFASQDAIGRVELGQAKGGQQDHDYLYAMVQDANLLNDGGVSGIDVPGGASSPLGTTVFNGLYVSDDFGLTWTQMTSGTELANDPSSGSSLYGTGTAIGYQPGVQAWYNEWVQPDPTRATADGVPTRLAFGLEEIWTNDLPQSGAPMNGPSHFVVAAKYFGGDSCLLLNLGLPACPGDRDPTDSNDTTHPDQQDGLWFPDKNVPGGVQLVVGNDGGAYRYDFADDSDGELDNAHWGRGNQAGFSTLMPYRATMAKDGTVFAGLQDNGNLKIDGTTRKQYETYGGDGFYAAVDPDDSDITYEEYTNAAISASTDGGSNWESIDPGLTASKFANPFVMDPTNAKHLLTAGREVVETLLGPSTQSGMTDADSADGSTSTWLKVFDLGTKEHPGDASASSSSTDPDNSMSAVDTRGDASYVAFCGQCDTLNKLSTDDMVFQNGLATNVGGDEPGQAGTSDGWHVVAARGLPNRYITSVAIDPKRTNKVYVTLGGYTRRWLPAGAVGDANKAVGTGHLFKSTDGGKTFRNISGNLPDSPATWVTVRKGQLLVGTDVGAFATGMRGTKQAKPAFARMPGLPKAPIGSIQLKPGNPNVAVFAMFGRDVWTYRFKQKISADSVPGTGSGAGSGPSTELGAVAKAWDFEGDEQGWTASGTPAWTYESPGRGTGAADDASGSGWDVSGPLGYVDNVDTTLVSPAVAMSAGDSVLQWWMKLDTEAGFDKVSAEVSTDGGSSWQTLGSYSGQSEADADGTPGWEKYAVPFKAGSMPVQVRFAFTSDSLCSNLGGPLCSSTTGWDGVHLDDVAVGAAR